MEQTGREFAEVHQVRFGTPVVASDGAAGSVAHVLINPAARAVTHVGVRLRWRGQTYSVPIAAIARANADGATLAIARDDLSKSAAPATAQLARLARATVVASEQKTIGRLKQISFTRDGGVPHRMVVGRGAGRDVYIAATSAQSFGEQRITVRLTPAEVDGLTLARADADLKREAEAVLFDYQRLRIDLAGIDLRAIDGEIWLLGHVSSELNSRLIVEQLRGLRDLAAIHNHLLADSDLAATVAAALARDPRTRGQHIGVYPTLGQVRLGGAVDSPAAAQAAAEIAGAVPGVTTVIAQLDVRPGLAGLPVFAGVSGIEDIVPGGG
ncbi:MAG TPA: BON domain-containing protein [Ktedonobacterales bacterium]|nr:BON domain-containing protein [Ktedonobacterales bacterium]